MRVDVYHHIPTIQVEHKFSAIDVEVKVPPIEVKVPQPFLLQITGEEVRRDELKGGMFMYIVKDDNVDVPYAVTFKAMDAEGNEIPEAKLTVLVESDNPDALSLAPDASDPKKGIAHFGNPGLANVNCTVTKEDGTVLGSFGAQFTVTVGDPAAIAGGTISFEGLTEV